MKESTFIILLPVFILLCGVVLEIVFQRYLNAKAAGLLAFFSALLSLTAVFYLSLFVRSAVVETAVIPWDGPLSFAYSVDSLSLLFAFMASGIGSIVLLYSVHYMQEKTSTTRFYVLMLVFIGGLIHLVFSADLFAVYLSWEIIGLCSFLLVGFWYQKPEAVSGARKVLVMTHIAGYGLLAAIILLYVKTGSTLWTDSVVSQALSSGIFFLILIAALAKSVQFPLQTWIPEAMAAPTPVSALLHAACYVKAGVYMVARLHSMAPWLASWSQIVLWLGTVTMVIGALYALIQTDLKRLLAFSTISQIGYMMAGFGLGTASGIAAGLLHCLNHGLFKGGLFLGAGAVEHSAGTRDMNKLGGLANLMPGTSIFWMLCAASIAGVPLMSGFVSKWLFYNAAIEAGQAVPALVAWMVSVLTVFYFLKATSSVFLGSPPHQCSQAKESPRLMLWAMGILAGLNLLLGIAPQMVMVPLINPVLQSMSLGQVDISWLGMQTATGSWWSSTGLLLAVAASGIGILIFSLARPFQHTIQVAGVSGGEAYAAFSGGEPLTGSSHIPASDFSAIIKNALNPLYLRLDVDRIYLFIWRGIRSFCQAVSRASAWLENHNLIWGAAGTFIIVIWLGFTSPAPLQAAEPLHAMAKPLFLFVCCALAWMFLTLSSLIFKSMQKAVPLMAFSGALALTGLWLKDELLRLLLLEAAAFITVFMVWMSSAAARSAKVYLAVILLSALFMFAGHYSLISGMMGWAKFLLISGYLLKLAVVPLYFWLPALTEKTPALLIGFIISIIDMAAFGEFMTLRISQPWMFNPEYGLWLLGCISALTGAVLMISQSNLKRLLACSTIEDLGFLLLSLCLAGEWGVEGAAIGAGVHALAKSLLFISLAAPEAGHHLDDSRSLTARYPYSGAGFLAGMLTMAGVPPFLGFLTRWRIYTTAAQYHPALLLLMLSVSALALLAYIRVFCRNWWGHSDEQAAEKSEPLSLRTIMMALILLLLLGGIIPGLLQAVPAFLGGAL